MKTFNEFTQAGAITIDNWYSNLNIPINESQFIVENGIALDSVFNKMHTYMHHTNSNNYITESYNPNFNILFNTAEQKAATDFLFIVAEKYANALLMEAGYITEELYGEGLFSKIGEITKKAVNKGKELIDKGKEVAKDLGNKLVNLLKFLKDLAKKGIQSVKQLVYKVVDLMLAFACKVDDLMTKLKVEKTKAIQELMSKIKLAFKDKKTHTNVYEAMRNSILETGIINESLFFESDEAENEYDKAKDAKAGDVSDKGWGGILGKALALILIQALAYTVVCVVIPAIITLIAGPIAGAIAENLAKILWSSGVIFHQIRAEIKLHQSGEFDKKYNTKWKKAFHYIFFFLNLAWAAWKAVSATMAMGKILGAWFEGNNQLLATVLPSAAVQNCATWMNNIWKQLSGQNAPGFDKMQETIHNIENGFITKVEKTTQTTVHSKSGQQADELSKKFKDTNWRNSTKAVHTMTGNAMSPSDVKSLSDNARVTVGMDGFFGVDKAGNPLNKWSADILNRGMSAGFSKQQVIDYLTGGNTMNGGLHKACVRAGSMAFAEVPGKLAKAIVGCPSANGVPVAALGIDSFKTITKHLTITTIKHLPALQNSFDWFGGFFELPSFMAAGEDGDWFILRLSSGPSKGYMYDIQGVKAFTWEKAMSEFSKYNPSVFGNMDAQMKANQEYIKNLTAQNADESLIDDLDSIFEGEDKPKSEEEIIKKKKKVAEYVNKQEICFVLYGVPYKPSDDKDNKEAKESLLNNLYDELFFESKKETEQRNKVKKLIFNIHKAIKTVNDKYNENGKTGNIYADFIKKYRDIINNYISVKDSKKESLDWASLDDIKLLNKIYTKSGEGDERGYYDNSNNKLPNGLKTVEENLNKSLEDLKKDYKAVMKEDFETEDAPESNNDKATETSTSTSNETTKSDNKSSESTNSGKLIPVAIFNTMLMAAGDIQTGRKSGPRKNPIRYKGLYGSYEILPKDGGLTEKEIRNWEVDVLQKSFMVCYDANPLPPCYKSLAKWKINKDAEEQAPGPRDDFGGFTNAECLEIAKGSKDIEKFFGGINKQNHTTLEKTNTDKSKAHHDKNIQKMADTIKNNDKVKAVLDKYPKLKDKLLDDDGNINMEHLNDIADTVTRIGNNYGKKKKGILGKIKDWFLGNKDKDKLDGYDPKALQELSYALHSVRANDLNSKLKHESYNYDENIEEIFECINDYLYTKDLYENIDESYNDEEEIWEELKPKYNSLSNYINSYK